MFSPDEIVMYGADLCRIDAVEELSFFAGQSPRPYYILRPISRPESTSYVPCDQGERKLRRVLTSQQIAALRTQTDGKALEWIEDRQLRSRTYTQILQQSDPEQILLLIRCLLAKKTELLAKQKKFSASDEKILVAAEKMIDDEFAYALDIDKEELPEFFANGN